jgi:hypothetical protein
VRRTARAIAALALALLTLTACGNQARDLFVVSRSGNVPGARLTLRVTDDGRVSCNGHSLVDIASNQLITARETERDLKKPATARLRLAPGREPVFGYRVRTQDGTVAWSDDSRGQPPVLFALAKLTRDVAKGPCHLAR